MPSYARHAARREQEEREAAERRRREAEEEAGRKAEEVQKAPRPDAANEEVTPEFVFESHARERRDTRAAQLGQKRGGVREPVGTRSISDPMTTEVDMEEEEVEEEEEEAPADVVLPEGLEGRLTDVPFKVQELSLGAVKKSGLEASFGGDEYGKSTKAGLIKMKVRVLEEETFVETVRNFPPPRLKQLYAEKMCKIRLYVYTAHNLSVRANGELPQPFLKVFNGTEQHQMRTTRDKPLGSTLNPDFWSSFELSAYLPGQSQLHVQVWDYSVWGETQIGGTVIDLEDRLFSPQWQEMQRLGQLPKETRQLTNAGTATTQGSVVLRVEILERKFALANPMQELSPPVKEQYELRLIVWEAQDVTIKDEVTGQSDVFVTVQPRGDADYEKQSTDTHYYSSGDAEFNWRMIWPIFLPERVPRLFLQVWDYGAPRHPRPLAPSPLGLLLRALALALALALAPPPLARAPLDLRPCSRRHAPSHPTPPRSDLIGANDAVGEAELNLKPLYEKALKRRSGQIIERQWVPCTHPNYVGVQARVCLTIEVLTRAEAVQRPAGKARDAPNENPHLDEPIRPTFLDALGINLNMFNPFMMFRRYFVIFCVLATTAGVVVLVVLLVTGSV